METEKLISLLCGDQFMNTKALPEYDILSLEMSDGPMGLRYQKKDKDSLGINRSEPATCLPAGVAVAAKSFLKYKEIIRYKNKLRNTLNKHA